MDLRWTHKGQVADMPYNFTIGTNYDHMEDDRKGYENFVANVPLGAVPRLIGGQVVDCGMTLNGQPIICGVKGNLRRDETNEVSNFDQYLQAAIDLTPRWNLSAGLRHSRVKFENKDHFLLDTGNPPAGYPETNGDDSGSVTFRETTPVIGAIFKATDTLNLYANAGQSFETPTFVEMAYTSTGGFNLDLKPAKSNQYEVGAKWMVGDNTIINGAFFFIDTEDEIVVQQQAGGRTVYQNVKDSERKGFELSIDSQLGNGLSTYLAYSYLDAEFTSDFTSCRPFADGQTVCLPDQPASMPPALPANSGGEIIRAGADIPGTYKHTLFGELAWRHQPSGFSTALEIRAYSKTYVAFRPEYGKAAGYAIASWRGGFNQKVGDWKFSEFVRVENLFDKDYVGSIRVGDLNGNYYEPAPGRNWLLGFNASYRF
jgi:iron complex outermembrane receptor protein